MLRRRVAGRGQVGWAASRDGLTVLISLLFDTESLNPNSWVLWRARASKWNSWAVCGGGWVVQRAQQCDSDLVAEPERLGPHNMLSCFTIRWLGVRMNDAHVENVFLREAARPHTKSRHGSGYLVMKNFCSLPRYGVVFSIFAILFQPSARK